MRQLLKLLFMLVPAAACAQVAPNAPSCVELGVKVKLYTLNDPMNGYSARCPDNAQLNALVWFKILVDKKGHGSYVSVRVEEGDSSKVTECAVASARWMLGGGRFTRVRIPCTVDLPFRMRSAGQL